MALVVLTPTPVPSPMDGGMGALGRSPSALWPPLSCLRERGQEVRGVGGLVRQEKSLPR